MAPSRQAFMVRLFLDKNYELAQEGLDSDSVFVGWSELPDLLDNRFLTLSGFRELIRDMYFPDDSNNRRAGRSAGEAWRFIRKMEVGDLVVMPYDHDFYVARVVGRAEPWPHKVPDDTATRRRVEWLCDKQAIPAGAASLLLQKKLRSRWTVLDISELVREVEKFGTPASRSRPIAGR